MKKRALFILMMLFSSQFLFAQNNNDEWQLIKTVDNVSAYYKKSVCNGNEVLIVKFMNSKDQAIKVTWSLWNGVASRTTNLEAGQIKEGACDSSPAFMLLDRVPAGLTISDMNASINIQLQ